MSLLNDLHVASMGMMIPGSMGMNPPFNFQLDGKNAAINGDFMPHKLSSAIAIAVIGIDIGKNSFTWWGTINVVQSCFARNGRAGRWRHGWPTCRRVSSAWRLALGRII